jgi:hypothetical protein
MSILWRDTLVSMQGALQGAGTSLALSESREGYALLAALQTAGTAYDALGNDGATNSSAFTVLLDLYVSQASPVFIELDRVCRWVYSLYVTAAFFQPQYAADFGAITEVQAEQWESFLVWQAAFAAWQNGGGSGPAPSVPNGAAIPSLTPPAALTFDYSGGNFGTLGNLTTVETRVYDAAAILAAAGPAAGARDAVFIAANAAWNSGVWWDNGSPPASHAMTSPPVNNSAPAQLASQVATFNVNVAVDNCKAWLTASTFT